MNKAYPLLIMLIITLSGLTPLLRVDATPTYYGDYLHATLLESDGLVRKWLVTNQTELFLFGISDTSSFPLTLLGTGSGVLGCDTVETIFSLTSGTGNYSEATINSIWSIYDWSDYNYLRITYSLYDTTGVQLVLRVLCVGGTKDYIFTGSTEEGVYNIKYADLSLADSEHVNQIRLFVDWAQTTYTLYMPNMSLTTLNVTESFYEIWDGSTFKWRGSLEPDINDFVTQPDIIVPTDNGWFNFILLIIVFGLALIGIKIPITAFPSMVIGLYLIIQYADFAEYQLLYIIIILLSFMLDIMDLVNWRSR